MGPTAWWIPPSRILGKLHRLDMGIKLRGMYPPVLSYFPTNFESKEEIKRIESLIRAFNA
jgi:hypothetical protein